MSFLLGSIPDSAVPATPHGPFAHVPVPVAHPERHRRKGDRHGRQAGRKEDRDPRHRRRGAGRADRAAQGARGRGRDDRARELRGRRDPGLRPPRPRRQAEGGSHALRRERRRLRRPADPRRRRERRLPPRRRDRREVRRRLRRGAQADRGDLPRPMGPGRGGHRQGPDAHLVPVAADRHPQRRRHLGRRGGPRRPGARDEPQARRHPRLQRQGDRGVLRGRAREHAAAGGRGGRLVARARTGNSPCTRQDIPGAWGILGRMARSIWTGAISFGLVTVPVKLYSAVSRKTVRFHQLNGRTGTRIQQKRVDPTTGDEVAYDDIVKGFEIGPDRYVIIEPGELEALDPKKTKSIEIEDFVSLDDIDPIFYDHPYYLAPGAGGAKPYRLLLEAMRESGKVAIAKVVIRQKENLVAIRPMEGDVLGMATMIFADEVVDPDRIDELDTAREVDINDRELSIAKQLVESLSGEFEPGKYRDTYREDVLALIERKAAGEEIAVQPAREEEEEPVPDLMAALKASLDAVRERDGGGSDDDDADDGAKAKPKRKAPAKRKAQPKRKAPAKKAAAKS